MFIGFRVYRGVGFRVQGFKFSVLGFGGAGSGFGVCEGFEDSSLAVLRSFLSSCSLNPKP